MSIMPSTTVWYPAKDEKNVNGRFGYEKIYDIPASKAADEKRYKDVLVLYTRVTGDIDVPAPIKVSPDNRIALIARFPEAWKAWETKTAVEIPGTPMDGLELSEDKLLELRLFGVYRMEQLAAISDQQCENMGFGTKSLRGRARELTGWAPPINGATAGAVAPAVPTVATAAPPAMTQGDIDRAIADGIGRAMAAMAAVPVVPAAQVPVVQAEPAPKRRGRPPKVAAETAAA